MHVQVAPSFFLGVNYPWVNYGQDFGVSPWGHSGVSVPATSAIVQSDFERIRNTGATVIRWFLFCDGRSGIKIQNGIPVSPDESLLADIAAALELARKNDLKICFPLIDFLWMQNSPQNSAAPFSPSQNIMKFAAGREALLEKVFIPVFSEFKSHSAIFAWEVANEPEWSIPEFNPVPQAGISFADFRAFATEVVDAIHEFARAPATLGSARLQWVRAWAEIGLDLYQAHYYCQAEKDRKDSFSDQIASLQNLDKPLWLGELPASDPAFPGYAFDRCVSDCRSASLAGASVWRWRQPEPGGQDVAFGAADPEILSACSRQATEFRV